MIFVHNAIVSSGDRAHRCSTLQFCIFTNLNASSLHVFLLVSLPLMMMKLQALAWLDFVCLGICLACCTENYLLIYSRQIPLLTDFVLMDKSLFFLTWQCGLCAALRLDLICCSKNFSPGWGLLCSAGSRCSW